MTDDRRGTEAAVLANYRKENPSTHFLVESEEAFAVRRTGREALFRDNLKLPLRMFDGASLLDLGAGTGENAVYYGVWGARCCLVEINDGALDRARAVFDRYLPDAGLHQFHCSSLFDFESPEQFDIVVSEGVIHHTADKAGAFAHLVSFAKPGGYVVLSVGNAAGCFQRSLQRAVLFRFAKDEEAIVTTAERLFGEHIDRAAKHGQRSRRAVIYDSFVNPKVDFPSAPEVLGWFRDHGLKLHATWPPVVPALLGDSGMRATFDPLSLPQIAAAAEAVWLAHDRDDAEELPEHLVGLGRLAESQAALTGSVNDFGPNQDLSDTALAQLLTEYRSALTAFDPFSGLRDKAARLLAEVEQLLALVEQNDLEATADFLPRCQHLFRGTGGLGISRYVCYLPEHC